MRSHYTLIPTLLAAALLPAQQVRTLAKPDAELSEPFTNLNSIRELKDGRVIAVDVRDKVVQLVDFKSKSLRKIGREGSGPKEYALPMGVLGLPGDTSIVYDPLNSRSLVILPNGEPGEFLRTAPARSSGPGGGMMISMQPPRFSDDKGRLYTAGNGVRMGPDGPVIADSLPIMRFDRGAQKTDTVAWIRQPKDAVQASGGAGRMSVRIGGGNPYAPRDDWAVTPDGRVAVIRSPEYRIDWNGKAGTAIPYEKIKLAEGHKQLWRESRKNALAIAITNNNGRQTATSGPPPADVPDPGDWPEFMPPFVGGNNSSVLVAPNGMIWLLRTREAKDNVPKYDVIDASGKVVYRVAVPSKTRVVGFGAGTVYTIRTDDDDLQYLQRYKAP